MMGNQAISVNNRTIVDCHASGGGVVARSLLARRLWTNQNCPTICFNKHDPFKFYQSRFAFMAFWKHELNKNDDNVIPYKNTLS